MRSLRTFRQAEQGKEQRLEGSFPQCTASQHSRLTLEPVGENVSRVTGCWNGAEECAVGIIWVGGRVQNQAPDAASSMASTAAAASQTVGSVG